jgi:hypothetical protein
MQACSQAFSSSGMKRKADLGPAKIGIEGYLREAFERARVLYISSKHECKYAVKRLSAHPDEKHQRALLAAIKNFDSALTDHREALTR